MKKTERFLAAAMLACTLCLATGCATISPWERGYLAKPHMALEPHPAVGAMREHVYGSREAASGGGGAAAGGGCGCY